VAIRHPLSIALALVFVLIAAAPARAQRFRFERTIDVQPGATLDVATERGKIAVVGDDGATVRIVGTVTVRLGFIQSSDVIAVAQRVADHPRLEVEGSVVRLRPQLDSEERGAVTVSYEVRVPHETRILAASDSGAISVDQVAAAVSVTTQSSSIDLSRIIGTTEVKTGSGAVLVDRNDGGLRVVTSSSSITARGLRGALDIRTQSGEIRATFAGPGEVDIETGSSAVDVDGASGALAVRTRSGRVNLAGSPTAPWNVTTGSGAIEVALHKSVPVTLDASSGSGTVELRGLALDGPVEKHRASGAVSGGGPLVRLVNRSGSIRIGR
jgi:DUF4097 and DUF4098 domain-containing protein YvlB